MQLLYRRQVEVSGRHMAQLSQLLLAYSPVFVAASQHAAVWDLFTLLCYATRRRLRRKHNRDCLEAFLWGLYDPLSRDEEFSKNADGVHLLNTADGFVFGRPSPRATQGGSHLQLPSCNDVRVATLHHLLYRCLQTETSLQIDAQAAAHIELLLSWALLLAGDDMRPFMRDAVVHRLCKPITPSNTGASAGRRISTLESVRQWRRLALRHNEAPLRHVEENDKGGRGKHGKALLPAAAVFNTVEREARQTGGWAVPAMERCLLSTLMHSTHLPTGTQRNTSSAATTRYRKPTRSTKAEKTESELRLAGAAAATPRAYARLRWGSLDSGLPPYSSTTTPTAARLLQRRQASSEEEIAELMHTALELPKHAWCLAEAVAVRLVRCLRLRAAYPVAAPRATSVTRRQLLAAFRRLARHSRVGVLTHALVLESDDTATLSAAPTKDGCGEDPFSFAEFAAAATLTLVRHIHSDEDAAQIIGVWWYERSTAATHISPDVLRRLRAWVEALPPPLLSEQLARTFEQLSQLETSVPSSASFAGSYLLTSSEDKVNDSEAKEVWKAIIAAAQPHNTAQPVQVQDGGASSVGASIDTPTAPSFSFSTTPHQSSVKDAVTVRSGNVVSLRRLQWIALLNDSPRREWRWLGISAEPHSWTEQCRLVEASEKAELTAVEQHNATDLGDRCLHGQCETATASWRALRRWGWLDELMTTYSGQDGRAGLAEECGRGRLEDEELGRTAAAAETAAHDGLSPSACLGASQIITHFVRIACHTFQTLSATGATHARHSPAPAAADTTRTPVTSQTYAAPFETWEEALRTLASYCELLATNAEEVKEHDSARAVHHKKLLCAASAFIECSIAFWRALHAPLFTSADVNDAADVSSVLCAQYKTILDLHSAVALAQQKLALHHPGEEEREAAASALPSLPAELHADVFRLLTHARVPRWRQCEALLLLADDVATLSSAGAKTAGGGTPMTAARATPTWQGSFEIPLFVYAEVLTAYAAHQQPVPQQLRERCMRRLRGAL
ncbi:hypothetical protein ABB37_05583 [Leptomonas pyrrhocoris]|uniref:Uncharacterized protein n=1 Tax=Leptomonas pyrrhocoris TaxID=157538 RepID=A0A0M9FZ13_LEPPY|nr:hypothetical protein ABB37_05583 [Leptomonas pyrrhocoris]KPA79050.1 hypothetical protein ABB37_05583 [Leptomonas pyrrhocoris]|eukprot:XP_015657489.1 hypothetical protein ABB37_05583 [Leptomonas pyrrhocoris]